MCVLRTLHDGAITLRPDMVRLHVLEAPDTVSLDGRAEVVGAGGVLVGTGLVALARAAVDGLGNEGDARGGGRVNADAHVGQVVDRVELGAHVVEHVGLQLVCAVVRLVRNEGVDVRRHDGAQQLLVTVVEGREGCVADVGDGLAVAEGLAGELGGEGCDGHGCGVFVDMDGCFKYLDGTFVG